VELGRGTVFSLGTFMAVAAARLGKPVSRTKEGWTMEADDSARDRIEHGAAWRRHRGRTMEVDDGARARDGALLLLKPSAGMT
jgi:hypothetical protein